MAVMTSERIDDPGRLFTVDDLEATPDDGRRYEIVDGSLLVTPSPRLDHQQVIGELYLLLRAACPPGLLVVPGPVDVVLSEHRVFAPDVLVVQADADRRGQLKAPPLLLVEVRSPSTALIDHAVKHQAYAEFGVPSYWIADPETPSLTVFELGDDGAYVQVAHGTGAETVRIDRPFLVEVVPEALVAT